MFLHRLHLDPRCREARRDLADPYQMHATLCRAFSEPEQKCPEGTFLWRLEPERNASGCPKILVQSTVLPDWRRISIGNWFDGVPDPPIDLASRLLMESLGSGCIFRFRLRANPCVTREGKRLGLLKLPDQEAWLYRKGDRHGFRIEAARVSQEAMLRGKQHGGNPLHVFSVLFDGRLAVSDPTLFREAIRSGIGHGKALGLGLLSVAPVP